MSRVLGGKVRATKESKCGKDEGCNFAWRQGGYRCNNGVYFKDKTVRKICGITAYYFFQNHGTSRSENVFRKDKGR